MKKQIVTIAASILIAAAVFIPLFLFVRTVTQDHKTLNQVVTFINNSVAAQQAATPATK